MEPWPIQLTGNAILDAAALGQGASARIHRRLSRADILSVFSVNNGSITIPLITSANVPTTGIVVVDFLSILMNLIGTYTATGNIHPEILHTGAIDAEGGVSLDATVAGVSGCYLLSGLSNDPFDPAMFGTGLILQNSAGAGTISAGGNIADTIDVSVWLKLLAPGI